MSTTAGRPAGPPPPPPPGAPGPAGPGTTSGTTSGTASGTASGTVAGGTAAGRTPPPAADGERPFGRPVPTEHFGWFARVPLRTRLVAIIALLLAAGLGVAALITATAVRAYLVDQVDDELRTTVASINDGTLRSPSQSTRPSDYYVLVRTAAGQEWPDVFEGTAERYGVPAIPGYSDQEITRMAGHPFTVHATSSDGTAPTDPALWRVIVYPAQVAGTSGEVFVALPLTGIHETVRTLIRVLALSALAIVLLGAATAWLAVHRSLRPLREIEETAADIAAGDMSRRVRPGPPTTEVGSLAVSLNAMLAQIETAFSAQEASEARMRRFVSDASHELRTPLATIRGYGELYRMGALRSEEQVEDTMGRIEDAATRMGTLVNDLLALARLDEGRPVRHEPVDLVRLARDSVQDLHALDPSRTSALQGLDGGPAPADLVVTGDEDRLRQVLSNLVGNVARHTPAGTPVELALGTDDGRAVLEVRDHGPGVTPEQASRVFERFYRADSSRNRESGGSGLGLAIVAAIVGAHDGHVEVAATPGGGLTVRVSLPRHGYDVGSSS